MSVNIGSIVGTLKIIDEASGIIGKVQAGIGGLTGIMGKMGGVMGDVGGIINSAFSGFATGGPAGLALGAGAAILGTVVTGIQSCVKEATASEAVWASLGAAVGRTGESWQALKKGTEAALLAMSKVTTYSDEQLAVALEKLMTFGLSYDDAMKALGKTIDFAAAKHMDLGSAATIVGKAMDGNTAILKRYGVDVTTTKDATAALKDAHDAAKIAIEGMGKGVDAWVISVSAAIAATPEFEAGLAGAKDKAGYLIDQFQQGNIDLPQFTQAMTSLGVPLDETKMKAGGAEEVLKALNTQFGGAAVDAAKTYAGTQERLKNATGEVSEKIGMMLLPALASMTEAMIPVVDWLGEGVDAIGAWLTEVGKMPEVQAVMTVVNEAFAGFWKYLEDVWKFIQDTFGPALQELWSAFKELWDALSPIGEALQELLSIFGDIGSIDLLKMVLGGIVLEIRAVAAIIKEVAPYIKAFAQGFKDAADFITPILKQIVEAIEWFCGAVKLGFQTLYTWLVGASLWQDMWNTLSSVASTMIGALLGDLGSKFFEPIKNVFTGAMRAIEDLWNKGWDAVQTGFTNYVDNFIPNLMSWGETLKTNVTAFTDSVKTTWDTSWQAVQATFETVTTQIQGELNTRFDQMKGFVTSNLGEYAPIANTALSGMQAAMNAVMALIHGDWRGFLNQMDQAMNLFWNAIQAATTLAFTTLQTSFTSSMDTLKGILDFAIGAMQGAWNIFTSFISQGIEGFKGAISDAQSWLQSTFESMQATAASAMASIQSTVMAAVSAIVAAAQSLWNQLVGGSIWTDMLDEMQAQAQSALGNIVGDFQGAFSDVALSVPTMPSQASPSRGSETSTPMISQLAQSITVPVQVQIDGATVARTVTTRLVRDISARRTMR
jgi:phage-related protein